VRPFAWFGRFGQQVFERVFVNGALSAARRASSSAGSAAVRALQNGLLRSYAALLLLGSPPSPSTSWRSHDDPPLDPALAARSPSGCSALVLPRAAGRWLALLGASATLGYAIALVADFEPAPGCSTSPTRCGSPSWASTTSSASTA
jgi:hypothetical protein